MKKWSINEQTLQIFQKIIHRILADALNSDFKVDVLIYIDIGVYFICFIVYKKTKWKMNYFL